jgi:nucleolar protein 15
LACVQLSHYYYRAQRLPRAPRARARSGYCLLPAPSFLPSVLVPQHIPHGFYEAQLRGYLSQFGDVRHVYLSRSRKTARSRGYAFVQFRDALVARIASEALNGYPLGGKVVRSSVVDPAKAHPSMFEAADRKWRKIPWRAVIREAQAAPRSATQVRNRQAQAIRRESKASAKRAKAGFDLECPTSFVALAAGAAAGTSTAVPIADVQVAIAKKRKRAADGEAVEQRASPAVRGGAEGMQRAARAVQPDAPAFAPVRSAKASAALPKKGLLLAPGATKPQKVGSPVLTVTAAPGSKGYKGKVSH